MFAQKDSPVRAIAHHHPESDLPDERNGDVAKQLCEHAAKTNTEVDASAKNSYKDSKNEVKEASSSSSLQRAETLYWDDKLLEAARILKSLDPELLKPEHHQMLRHANAISSLVGELKSSVLDDSRGWIKQGESQGKRDFMIYYKMDKATKTKLTVRVETPLEPSLLVPLLSVLNESELYPTWLPNWKNPRLRVRRSEKIKQSGRCSQIIVVTTDIPWPLKSREAVIRAVGCDDIDQDGVIAIKLDSLQTGDEDGLVPPPVERGTVRIDFDGGFMFRRCPGDHAALRNSKTRHKGIDEKGEKTNNLVLVTFSMCVDALLPVIPQSFINFVMRTAIGRMWSMFLQVAEEVRDGKRPQHSSVIEEKRTFLYDWVDSRIQHMFVQFEEATSDASTL